MSDVSPLDLGVLVFRVVLGFVLLGHGIRKLLPMREWRGLDATVSSFSALGMGGGRLMAAAAAVGQLVGGASIALGLLTALGSALSVSVMVVAVYGIRSKGFWTPRGGIEYPFVLTGALIALIWTGPGALSFDRLLWTDETTPWQTGAVLTAASVVGGLIVAGLLLRIGARAATGRRGHGQRAPRIRRST